ncbi:MAG: hypothetical protein M5U29_16220 [Anaerolineae bacterium]|nr:hypothetical protein [Anaerolineae bacterium]MCZ7541423.1 hypothetical protein [Anaerolineae bacterium]
MTAPEIKKLNAMRFLEAHGATYETHTYDEGITDGIGAAQAMGFPRLRSIRRSSCSSRTTSTPWS